MIDVLNPCRFCKGNAKIVRSTGKYYIACKRCGARLYPKMDSEQEAINKWNKVNGEQAKC